MDAEDLSELKYSIQSSPRNTESEQTAARNTWFNSLPPTSRSVPPRQAQGLQDRLRGTSNQGVTTLNHLRKMKLSIPTCLFPIYHLRSGVHSTMASRLNNAPSASAQRTRSRVISPVAPRAALTRTTSQSRSKLPLAFDSGTGPQSSTANATPPPLLLSRKKALATQRRLGVGRPKAIGGSGVRRSTARARSASIKPSSGRIVELVVPTLQAVREEEAAAASRASIVKQAPADSIDQEEEEDDGGISTLPPPSLQTKPRITQACPLRPPSISVAARLSALEDRIEKRNSALETKRGRVAVLYVRVSKLEAENWQMRLDLEAFNQQTDSGAEKQIISETPRTPSSRLSTPPPLENENERPSEDASRAAPPHQAPFSAVKSA